MKRFLTAVLSAILFLGGCDRGSEGPFRVTDNGVGYWGHRYATLLLHAKLKPFGYTTLVLSPKEQDGHKNIGVRVYEYTDTHINDGPLTLENELIRAVFERKSCRLISLTDKKSGMELISKPSCYFRYIEENPVYHMTSWREGPHMVEKDLNAEHGVKYTALDANGIFSLINYELRFGGSVVSCSVRLRKGSPTLEFRTRIDWNEPAVHGQKVPQLAFAVPVSFETDGTFVRDIPYGELRIKDLPQAVPALSYIRADAGKDASVALMTDTKYAFRCCDGDLSVTLTRSAYDPDPYPERGIHDVRIGVTVCAPEKAREASVAFCHPIAFLSATKHEGSLPLCGSALSATGAAVSAVKPSEDGAGTAVRLYDVTGSAGKARVTLCRRIRRVWLCRNDEKRIRELTPDGCCVEVDVPAYGTVTLVIH